MRLIVLAAGFGAAMALNACSQGEKAAETPAAAPAEETTAAASEPAPAAEAAPVSEPAPETATPADAPAADTPAETPAPEAAETAAAETATTEAAAAGQETGTVTLAAVDASGASLVGDVAKGKKIFAQCATCHTLQAGVNRVGPSLNGIIGRPAGTVPNFRYSAGNKNSGITWSEQELFAYLENPRAKVPGTIMAFVGLKDAQQRADVIAYIKTNGGE